MSFAESAGIITQTGTDTDLSGLTGVAGVTTTAYNYQTRYELDDKTLQIDGTCTQANTDQLIIDGPNPGAVNKMSLVISSGGTYTFGEETDFNDKTGTPVARTVVAGGAFLFLAKPTGPSSWKNEQAGILCESGGTMNIYGGFIRSNQAINFEAGSAMLMRDGYVVMTSDVGFINFYLRDATVDVIGFTLTCGETDLTIPALGLLANYDTFEGYNPIALELPVGPIDSLPHGLVILEKYSGGYKNKQDCRFRNTADDNDEYRFMEATIGNDLIVNGRGLSNDSRGWATHYIRWTPTFVDASTKAALLNIQVYMIDTDNSLRNAPYSPGDQIIDLLTLADGQFSATTLDVLTGVWHNDSDVTRTALYVLDDRMDINGGAIGYLYEISTLILDNSMVGEDTALVQMVSDVAITQTTIATVQAYTTIDDNAELYDRSKEELFSDYTGETVKDVTTDGAYLTPRVDLGINPAAALAYTITIAPVMVIKTNDFTGKIRTSGANIVTQFGTGGAINYEVDGELHIDDASIAWTASQPCNDIINDDAANNLVVNVAIGVTCATSEPGTGIGQVLIVNAVPITITVTDTSGTVIENARVYLIADETVGTITTGDVILTGLTNASGIITDAAFDYEAAFAPSGLDCLLTVRQGTVSPYKKPFEEGAATITSVGYTTTVALVSDE